ncbi:metallo-beta-lactamase superfamily protein [Pleomassaria siparia CBS 279.74]|uniref:Metallo-beta-lactamase superfamily protein n=1 Tax=Pleomassaria siparia CBS 279.74 TaxID=1314801 RepID=A0A6G1KS25_9PLEO|nr:metallo-beta-lactamase superfamily protein [Pleomassaria siparia CBS 279.74]
MASKLALAVPVGDITVKASLINPVNFGPAQIHRFMAPPVPGLQQFKKSPSFSFFIEHPSGRKLVFDLGIRKDPENYSKAIAEYLPTTKYNLEVSKNVAEILEEQGVNGEEIEAVIWSHWHWDHIGDPSSFPHTVDLVVGQGFKDAMLPGYPANLNSPIRESDYINRNLREINFDSNLKIGQFPAYDYFGDGSFYLLDSPGHAVGHLCGLARTTTGSEADTFVLMGGDICHYAGIFRPSKYLPVPDSITPHPYNHSHPDVPFCPGSAFEELQHVRDRKPSDTLYDMTFGHDIPLATNTMGWLQELDCDDNIFVIIAHDSTVRDGVEQFPKTLNHWKEKSWGRSLKWAFFRDLENYWKEKGVA